MKQGLHIPQWGYKALLVLATMIWGLSFVVMKDTVEGLTPLWLLGIRFTICGVLLGVFFAKRIRATFNRTTVIHGVIVGALLFGGFWAQTYGIVFTTPGKNAFLTAAYCVIVPFVWWLVDKRKPTVWNILAAVICLAGIGLVANLQSMDVNVGDLWTLLGALLFAVHIVAVSTFTKTDDVWVLTFYQFVVMGLLGLLFAMPFEPVPTLSIFTPDLLWNMVYLIVFASLVALGIQNAALVHVPPTQASLFLSLESVFGVLFSILLYGEVLNLRLIVGFALIFVAIVISESFPGVLRTADKPDGPDTGTA